MMNFSSILGKPTLGLFLKSTPFSIKRICMPLRPAKTISYQLHKLSTTSQNCGLSVCSRTHTCGDLNTTHVNERVRLSGWIHYKSDHGNLLFIDLRDHYGLVQCVIDQSSEFFQVAERATLESVLTLTGKVIKRTLKLLIPIFLRGKLKCNFWICTWNQQRLLYPFR